MFTDTKSVHLNFRHSLLCAGGGAGVKSGCSWIKYSGKSNRTTVIMDGTEQIKTCARVHGQVLNANFNPDGNCNVNWNLKSGNANPNLGVRSVVVSGNTKEAFQLTEMPPFCGKLNNMKRILTGDRPTYDSFHLGNYVGSLKNRVKLQDEYETFILIADLHALTTHFDKTVDLEKNIRGLMLGYLSVGLDPNKVTFCLQSQLTGTTELAYILGTLTSRAVLERQPALKEKLDQGEQDTFALYQYPVLMAADILLPRANLVPVGKDQKAHVEFARDIAIKFNNLYGEVFPVPEPLIGEVPTLPGTDGRSKMGKSLNNAIFLTDTSDEVEKKVMSMYTDPKRIHATDPGTVEGNPVFIYLDAFGTEEDRTQINQYKEAYTKGQVGDIEVKKYLAKILNNFLDPIRIRRAEFEKQPELVEKILREGTQRAREEAQKTLDDVKSAMRLNYFQ